MSLKGTNRPYRLEGDVLNRDGLSLRSRALVLSGGLLGLGGGLGGIEVAENGDVGILVETGIRLKARFGVQTTAEDTEIVREEADAVFEAGAGKVVLKVMGTTAGKFDKRTRN